MLRATQPVTRTLNGGMPDRCARLEQKIQCLAGGKGVARQRISLRPSAVRLLGAKNGIADCILRGLIATEMVQTPETPNAVLMALEFRLGEPFHGGCPGLGESGLLSGGGVVLHAQQ